MDARDPFRDLTFDGRPGQYREFRRKVILAVAALEDKNQYLAGAKLLGRLTGEAWRCTEHLSVAEIRSQKGWLIVLDCLDKNYKHLPEVELHESIDDFLFHLKRKPNEGTTAFSARFKTALARLEYLISQEREMSKKKRQKKDHGTALPGPSTPDASSLGDSSSETEKKEEADQTDENEEQTETQAQQEEVPLGPFDPPLSRSGGSEKASQRSSKKHSSAGSWKADLKRSQLEMQRMLGALEPSHRRPRPIFPQSVLGHLFMRKFGLNREQRSLVIRSTGGSSRYQDVERILRASDLEDQRPEDRRHPKLQLKPQRRETYAVQEEPNESSSLDVPLSESDESADVMLGEGHDEEDDSNNEELEEIYEMQKRAKRDFKKSFKIYKESKRRVKEIKKTRAGPSTYYPVVAVPPGTSNAESSHAQQGTKPFKSQGRGKKGDGRSGKPSAKREEVNMTQTSIAEEFSYMVNADNDGELEVFLASIPEGYAIIDTACTTSVIGERTAEQLSDFFQSRGYPPPQQVELPAVELKGFNGKVERATRGLKWTVKLGSLQGHITTYIIPGVTPFLLSRRVLEAMEAILDLQHHTITSAKHEMHQVPLRQASNDHLLMPLCPTETDLEVAQCSLQSCPMDPMSQDHRLCTSEVNNEVPDNDSQSMVVNPSEGPIIPEVDRHHRHSQKTVSKTSPLDRKRAFQTIVKNTKNGIVDVELYKEQLSVIYPEGSASVYAATAYRPKKERVPKDSNSVAYECSVASLSHDGTFDVSPWRTRIPSEERRPVSPMSVAIFAFRHSEPKVTVSCVESFKDRSTCFCCSETDPINIQEDDTSVSVETLYEEVDWIDVDNQRPLPEEVAQNLSKGLSSLRKASSRLILSRLGKHRSEVRAELQAWLGDQKHLLDKKVGLVEVFTGKANLSTVFERKTGLHAIRLGLEYGQDFTRVHDRRCLLLLIAYCRPKHLWFSFPCKYWSPWTHLNMSKSKETHDEIVKQRDIARRYLHNVSEAWNLQRQLGGEAYAENPLSSQAWAELSLGSSWEVRIDQCALGLRSPKSDLPVLKPTRIVATQQAFVSGLVTCRCDGRHHHEHLAGTFKGKNLTSWAETYPNKFCKKMVELMQKLDSPKVKPTIQEILAEDDEELEEEEEIPKLEGGGESEDRIDRVEINRARVLVRKVHVNTGHSSKEQMMRLAVRCKSSEAIKQAIRNFKCSVCDEIKLPPSHRVAAMPHSDQPNTVVGIDYVQVELKRENKDGKEIEIKRNVLTAVDLATDFCQQIVVPPGPYGLSNAFHNVWGRPYGVPKVIFMDPDHRNISTDFQQYLARNGIQLLHTAADSHWQLGKVVTASFVVWPKGYGRLLLNQPPKK